MENTNSTYNKTDQGSLEGYTPVRRSHAVNGRWGTQEADPVYESRVTAAVVFLGDVLMGRAPAWALKEAIVPSWAGQSDLAIRNNYPELYRLTEAYSTSDFPFLMGDVLDRMMLANFQSLGHNWQQYCRQ